MNKTLLVFKNELLTTIKRKSFIITLLMLPLVGMIFTLVIGNKDRSSGITNLVSSLTTPQEEVMSIGILDETNSITEIPEDLKDHIKLYSTQQAAERDLNSIKIKAFYLIPDDYVQQGEIIVYRPDFNPLSANNDNYLIENLINSALLSENLEIMSLVNTYPIF